MNKSKHSQRGAAFVEFALALLLMLFFTFGIMEAGRFIYSYNVLAGATREGARYAIVHGSKSTAVATEDDIRAEVRRWAIGLDRQAVNVLTSWSPANTPGSIVQIQTTYRMTPFSAFIFNRAVTIGSRSRMVISQ